MLTHRIALCLVAIFQERPIGNRHAIYADEVCLAAKVINHHGRRNSFESKGAIEANSLDQQAFCVGHPLNLREVFPEHALLSECRMSRAEPDVYNDRTRRQ